MKPEDADFRAYLRAVVDGGEDPRRGLPDSVFDFLLMVTPMINVDLLVQDGTGRTLLAWRRDEWSAGWHIPGGIVRFGESLAHRITEVSRLEIGATVEAEPAPCNMVQFREGDRGHFISLLFRCRIADDAELFDSLDGDGHAAPMPGTLAWCTGVPAALYPAHEVYRPWLEGRGSSGTTLAGQTVLRNRIVQEDGGWS